MGKSLADYIKELQTYLNNHGAKLTVDGVFGPYTQAALMAEQDGPASKPSAGPTPWRDWFVKRKGWNETQNDSELSKGWPLVGLPQFRTVKGREHAWCGMSLATALSDSGMKYPKGAAGAANWDGFGKEIKWTEVGIPRGAIVRLRHAGGSAHVATADRDHAKGETIVDLLGGNQGDSIKVSRFDVSGNNRGHDQIMWVGWPV